MISAEQGALSRLRGPPHTGELCKNFIILFSAIYLRRYRREKEMRRKLEVELEFETRKKSQLEEAVKSLQFQSSEFLDQGK